jgi:hypothetical protein
MLSLTHSPRKHPAWYKGKRIGQNPPPSGHAAITRFEQIP